ncbi:DUF4435 domain-containing protein [Burkholderia gladioli]|uniref:DUF4435 domain-containing protein n=1 Tax=Burkholderia gladioli TaxID=28095 RepID=UPI00163EC918|nr:DUF4435 domain-containing protein [Burkholderia gladioli]
MIPKRTIEEVLVRYKLEPTIREVFVEGVFDRDLYKWFLKKMGLSSVKVYPISSVDVGFETLSKYALTSGERQRVIAFAREAASSGVSPAVMVCVIDSDLDYVLGVNDNCPLLVRTDGTSAELLAWRYDVLERFCIMVLGSDKPDEIIANLFAVESLVCDVFVLRAALAKLSMEWRLIDIDILFDRRNPITFEEYCKRVANKNGDHKGLEAVLDCLVSIRDTNAKSLPAPQRMHGHDLMEAARKVLQNLRFDHGCLGDGLDFSRTLMANLEWENVQADSVINSFRMLGHRADS